MAVDALRQLVQLCDQFESLWRAGDRPRIEALIADLDEPLRRQATEDLIAIELHWMRRLGERNLLGTYSERFPEHAPFIAQQCGGAGGAVVEDRRRPDFPPIGGTSKLEGGEHSDSAPAAAGRFRAVRPHATGGLGRIWLALDAELKREVAIKELLNEHANRPDARERFVLEAEVTARLEHPGIVPVYGLGTAPDGRPFYAMRLIQGKSLEVAIQELHDTRLGSPFATRRLLETRRLLNRFLAVCAAIDFAHSRGVVHRDIKPANVMLGEFGETLVVDWGMALLRSPPGEASSGAEIPNSRTEEEGGARILGGTPQYMSPEQAAGDERAIGPASDIYNLGATLYQLLTGRPAFPKASTPSVVLDAVQRADFAPPRQVCPTVPAALQAVCLKAMAREPGDRYASARALSEDLERWLADEPVAAYREPMGERLARVFRKHRLAVLVGTLGLVAITLAALVATLLVYRASREETRLRLLAEFRTRESQAALARVEQQERAALAAQQAAETQERAALAARQAAELQERRARAATDFLASIFATSDPLGLRGMGLRKVADQGRPLTPLEILNRGLERVDQELAGDPLLQATLLDALGSAYLGQGDLEQAAKLIERAWETRRSRLPERHPELLASMTSRASLMIVDGRMSEAESLLRVVLAAQETDTTAEELKVAETRFLLALALREQYQVDESMKLLRGSLAVRDKRQGLTHPDTLLARTLLVDSLLNQNRQAEATIEGMKLVSGDPRTASLLVGGLMRFQQMENLRRQRQFEAAAKIGDGLRSEATKVLGDSHPLTATLHFHHAMLWRQQGKRLEADALTERVLGQLSVAVVRMPRMSEVYYRLAQSVAERGQHEAAERHFRDAYSTGGTIYIKENAWGLKAGFALAGFLRDRGRGDAAVTLAREVLKRVPAQDAPMRRDGESMLYSVLAAQRNWREARPLAESLHAWYWSQREAEPSAAVLWARHFADCLRELGEFDASREWENAAFDLSRSMGPAASTPLLAACQFERGDWEGTWLRVRQSLAEARNQLRAEQPDIAAMLIPDSVHLWSLADPGEAIEPLQEIEAALREKLGDADRATHNAMVARAACEVAAKNIDAAMAEAALDRARNAFALRQKHFGASDPQTLALALRVAAVLRRRGNNAEAEMLLRQSSTDLGDKLAASAPLRFQAALELADLWLDKSEFAQANASLSKLLGDLKEATPAERHGDSWRMAEVRVRMARALSEQDQVAEAEPLLLDNLTLLEKAFGPRHPRVRAAAAVAARHFSRKGDEATAEQYRAMAGNGSDSGNGDADGCDDGSDDASGDVAD
jgi:hypothetical protein